MKCEFQEFLKADRPHCKITWQINVISQSICFNNIFILLRPYYTIFYDFIAISNQNLIPIN